MDANTPFYLSRSFWVAILTPLFLLLNQKFGLALSAEQIVGFVLPIVAYLVAHNYRQAAAIQATAAQNEATANAEPPKPAVTALEEIK